MKKTLLFAAVSISLLGNAQNLSQTNEAAIGTTSGMYLCDSFTVDYAGTIGTGITWDYSNLVGIPAQTRNVGVIDATTAPNASDFTASTFAYEVESSVTSFYNSTAASKISQGFVFNEPTLGLVVAKFDTDDEIVVTYPFAFGNTLTDTYAGSVDYTLSGIPMNSNLTGTAHATIDGVGTLLLPQSVSLSAVIRYKIVDTSLMLAVPVIGDVEIIRQQFEYYDLANGNLPVLTLTKMIIQNPGSSSPISEQQLVLSLYEPTLWLGLEDQEAFDFSIFPNPTKGYITVNGEFSNDATAEIVDQSGRVMTQFEVCDAMTGFCGVGLSDNAGTSLSIDMNDYEKGIYFLRISDQSTSTTKRIVKQ